MRKLLKALALGTSFCLTVALVTICGILLTEAIVQTHETQTVALATVIAIVTCLAAGWAYERYIAP